ncbi:MAG: hypothetical protein IJU60_01810 [Acholeplasmatales bacterium]|nr:hypothetical protein [Acholeplasmatales bacterium]
MSKLFIYYSFSGNGDVVAKALEEKGFEIRKVESKLKLRKNLFLQMMKGGFLASIGAKPKLINYNNNVDGYEEIYIGAPIWNGRLACPVNTILRDTNLDDKKVAFILYSGSGTAKYADKKLNKLYPEAKLIHLQQPKNKKGEVEKLYE